MQKSNKLVSLLCLTAAATAVIHTINKAISYCADHMGFLSDEHGLQYNWKFGNIYYTKQGEGKPILLIHDLQSFSSDLEWKELVKQYAKNHTVYTIDLLGCGRSDKPAITYTNYLYVQLLTDFIHDVIASPVDVITSGDSCAFTAMACMADNTIFGKLIFISPDFVSRYQIGPTKNRKLAKFLFELPIIGTLIYNICHNTKFLNDHIKTKYFANPYIVSSTLMKGFYQSSHLNHSNGKYLFASIVGNYTTTALARAIKEINNNIVILYGTESTDGKRIAEEYQKLNPAVEIQGIPNTKRLPQIEQPNSVYSTTCIYL